MHQVSHNAVDSDGITVFLPIHKQLDKAKSIELIDRLLQYDRYAGIVPPAMVRIATLVLLYPVVSASSH